MNQLQNFSKGLLKENPILVLVLGTCPTLAVTTSAINGFSMGLAVTFVLAMSNMFISLLKNFISDDIRIPAFIVIIATFVTIVDLTLQAYIPSLYESLGLFIPLIVVNCIVLGRAEAFASKNDVLSSIIDGLGMGIGYAIALTILGMFREFLGTLSIFNYKVFSGDGALMFIMAPGAFICLGFLMALANMLVKKLK
ncbi:MAG: electron transport complex subunit E [Bacteroidales bacterium]|nr:electron transport complex subunit E [Bacteroidales bacterium]MBR5652021.1 electron transport complex subunit E [Bacteroidales bacterium]MBR5720621.1 electron transport complex subunit E [Bacteroidales bacterium]